MRTLWDLYMDAEFESTRLKWRIEERGTRKILSKDYGSMKTDELDNMKVYEYSIRTHKYLGKYVRVVVY